MVHFAWVPRDKHNGHTRWKKHYTEARPQALKRKRITGIACSNPVVAAFMPGTQHSAVSQGHEQKLRLSRAGFLLLACNIQQHLCLNAYHSQALQTELRVGSGGHCCRGKKHRRTQPRLQLREGLLGKEIWVELKNIV